MDSQKQSIIDRLKQANNILVTVSSNPSVDQLSACIGLTLMLNELDKHATAVFSGTVPSTLEFLQPEKTLEKNTDSLRDFIIALDKSKADKLRYKVEDKVVKIFITPYRTSISEKDLEFSQGDFNVDVVVCLGVKDQRDLDQAITSHGRILHDATVASINTAAGGTLGTLNWQNAQASSLSEMIASLSEGFDKNLLDTQIATALLTGVVAETDRFSNNKTTPETMKVSAQLMAAGANQQLVATKLAEPPAPPEPLHEERPKPGGNSGGSAAAPPRNDDGTLRIAHSHDEVNLPPPVKQPPEPAAPPEEEPPQEPQIHIDETGELHHVGGDDHQFLAGPGPGDASAVLPQPDDDEERPSGEPAGPSKFVLTPPTLGGTLTANSRPEGLEPATDPLSQQAGAQPILTHNSSGAATVDTPAPKPPKVIQPLHQETPPADHGDDGKNVTEVTTAAEESHIAPLDENSARAAAEVARGNEPFNPAGNPTVSLGAQPLGEGLHPAEPAKEAPSEDKAKKPAPESKPTEPLGSLVEPLTTAPNEPAPASASPSARPLDMPLPQPPVSPLTGDSEPAAPPNNNSPLGPPPPMPPPIVPNFGQNN